MRTTYRLFITLVAAGSMVPLGLTSASAAGGPLQIEQAAWFWHDQVNGSIAGSGVGQRAPAQASGTPEGYVSIGYTNGQSATGRISEGGTDDPADTPNREAYLRWDISSVPLGSTVTKFTFTIVIDDATSTPQPQTPVELVACAALNDWTEGFADPYSGKPTDNCDNAPVGKWDAAASSYTFEVAAFAQEWVTSGLNLGVGIRQKPGLKTPFKFDAEVAKTTAAIEFTAPPVTPPPTTQPTTAPTVPPVVDGNTGNVGAPPIDPGTYVPPQPQPQPQPQPPAQPKPSVAPTSQVFVPQSSGTPFSPDLSPTGAMWAGGFAALGLLLVTSLILGDPVPAAAVAGSRASDLDRVLHSRRTPQQSGVRMRTRTV